MLLATGLLARGRADVGVFVSFKRNIKWRLLSPDAVGGLAGEVVGVELYRCTLHNLSLSTMLALFLCLFLSFHIRNEALRVPSDAARRHRSRK